MNNNYTNNITMYFLERCLLFLLLSSTISTSASAQSSNADVWTERWMSCIEQSNPNPARSGLSHWINYEFVQPQPITTSHFWNANVVGESTMGARNVSIDYSLDGLNWETLGSYTFPKAPETNTYTGFAGPDFGGLLIKKILITVNDTYGNGGCASIGEVRFDIDPDVCLDNLDVCGVCNGPGLLTWYIDQDQDGLGDPDVSIQSCTAPVGYVDNNNDPCDTGLIGWETVGPLFAANGCTGCHGTSGGLNLTSYAGISSGGNYCGTDLLSGNTLVNIINISNYVACGNTVSFPSMNERTGGAMDAAELALLQSWIDGGALEDCSDDSYNDPCALVNISCDNNTITVENLNAPIAQVQIFDTNWQSVYSCSGDCETTETITVSEGVHHVKVNLYNATWQPICETLEDLNCSGGNPCDNLGGDSDGDGICNDNDNCVDVANPSQSDSNGNGIGDACESNDPCAAVSISCDNNTITVGNLNTAVAQVQIFDANWQSVYSCSGNCETTETINVSEGLHHIKVNLYTATWQSICEINEDVNCSGGNPCDTQGGDSDGDGICNDTDNCIDVPNPNQSDSNSNGVGDACESNDPCVVINLSCNNNVITIENLNSPISQVQVFDANWQTVFSCSGDCETTEIINVSSGIHHVKVNLYTATWQPICNILESLNCTGGNPCNNQGGDSDGDGVCNNNDNCIDVANPNQTDSNSNGVGDACESNDPCAAISIVCENNIITTSGLNGSPISKLQIFDANWQTVFDCFGNCNDTETIAIGSGVHHVFAKYYTSGWQSICGVEEDVNCASGISIESNGEEGDVEDQLDSEELGFVVYPNPADENIFVNLSLFNGRKGKLQMRDVLGRVVYHQDFLEIPKDPIQIVTPYRLTSGVYAISLKVEDQKLITELLVIARK